MTDPKTYLNKGFQNIYDKANNILLILDSYNSLNKFDGIDRIKLEFVEMVKLLQSDLIDDIDTLQNAILRCME